ncbi:hypothetical protein CB1_000692010 [Camelus ferus]|nr:hypothetical protein CB1_000692010 [Camelus ferus]
MKKTSRCGRQARPRMVWFSQPVYLGKAKASTPLSLRAPHVLYLPPPCADGSARDISRQKLLLLWPANTASSCCAGSGKPWGQRSTRAPAGAAVPKPSLCVTLAEEGHPLCQEVNEKLFSEKSQKEGGEKRWGAEGGQHLALLSSTLDRPALGDAFSNQLARFLALSSAEAARQELACLFRPRAVPQELLLDVSSCFLATSSLARKAPQVPVCR